MKRFILLLSILLAAAPASARTVTDSAGRKVDIPDSVAKVFAAGPPASVIVYMLAPQKLLGWTRSFSPEERPFIGAPYVDLPDHGRLTGRGNTANLEAVLSMKPDLIVDVGTLDATYVSLADRVQQQTGVPYVLIDGSFLKSAETFRLLGSILGEDRRAQDFAAYADKTLSTVRSRIAAVPADQQRRVYYGRGPNGLETGRQGSINLDILDAAGAVNVAAAAGSGGLFTVSPEQILAWNPDVILTLDPAFRRTVMEQPIWKSVKAVQNRRVYVAPSLPFGWFDSPPGANRLLGLPWLGAVLYPSIFPESLRETARDFYDKFYHVRLSDDALGTLVNDATAPP